MHSPLDALADEKTQGSKLPLIAPTPRVNSRRDRRAGPRVHVEFECEEHSEEARYFRFSWDLSTFGVALRGSGGSYRPGDRLSLRLHLPDGNPEPVSVRAEVVAVHRAIDGLRLAFRSPSVQTVRRISRFLQRRVSGTGRRLAS